MRAVVRDDAVLGGAPHLAGTRIGVRHLKERVVDDEGDPFAVAAEYDLDVADVFNALAYYYDHPDEMRALEAEHEEALRAIREESAQLRAQHGQAGPSDRT